MADVKKNPGGRHPIQIDQTEFEKLCGLQCTQEEICGWFDGIDTRTLNSWCKRTYGEPFLQVYDKKRTPGKISLRRSQFRLAEKSAAMAIFLGKQYLGQRDVIEERKEGDGILGDLLTYLKSSEDGGMKNA